MKTITAYKCEYCKKIYTYKSSAMKHEKKCFFNPITRSCATCLYSKKETLNIDSSLFTEYRACLKNIKSINFQLQTTCLHHHEIRDEDFDMNDFLIVPKDIMEKYDYKTQHDKALEKYIAKYGTYDKNTKKLIIVPF